MKTCTSRRRSLSSTAGVASLAMLSSVSCTSGFVAVPLPSTNIRVAPASPPAFSAGIRRLRAVTSCRRTRHENLTSGPLQLTSDNSDDFGDFRSRDNDDDDDDISKAFINLAYIDGALDDRIESISWLPSLSDRSSPSSEEGTSEEEPISITRIRKDSRIMPLFPMGSEIFTPPLGPFSLHLRAALRRDV